MDAVKNENTKIAQQYKHKLLKHLNICFGLIIVLLLWVFQKLEEVVEEGAFQQICFRLLIKYSTWIKELALLDLPDTTGLYTIMIIWKHFFISEIFNTCRFMLLKLLT